MAKRDKRFYEKLVHDAAEESCKQLKAGDYSNRPRHVKPRIKAEHLKKQVNSRMSRLDAHYRDGSPSFRPNLGNSDVPHTRNFLEEIRKEHEESNANSDSPEHKLSIIRMFEKTMRTLLQHSFDKKMTAEEFIQASEMFADFAVRDVLIEGNAPRYLDYAAQFLSQLRKQYGKTDAADTKTQIALKRVEDKLELGKEAYVVLRKQLQRQFKVDDLMDYSTRAVLDHPDRTILGEQGQVLTSEQFEDAMALSEKIYSNMLKGIGLDNVTPQHSYYTMVLCQRAGYVAQAEFMRLPKDHADKQGDSLVAKRNEFVAKRMPVLVKTVLEKYPLYTMSDPIIAEDNDNIYLHSTTALFDAIQWLDQQRGLVAERSR